MITDLSDEEYQNTVAAVAATKREKSKSLKEQTMDWTAETTFPRLWQFSRKAEEAKIVEKITKDELLEFYRTYIKKGGEKR